MPFPKCLLVYSQLRQWLRLPPFQAPLHRPFHDPVNLVPAQSQLLPHGLLTRCLQPVNHQPFHERREPAGGLSPPQLQNSHAMLGAFGPRWPGVQNRLILAGVQMPPLPFPLMVIQLATHSAFRARPTRHLAVFQIDVHFPLGQL